MNKIWLIACDSYRRNIKSWIFVSIVATPLLMILGLVLIHAFGSQQATIPTTAVVGEPTELVHYLSQTHGDYQVDTTVTTEERAKEHLRTGQITSYVRVSLAANGVPEATVVSMSQQATLSSLLRSKLQQYSFSVQSKRYQIEEQVVQQLTQPVSVTHEMVYLRGQELVSEQDQHRTQKFVAAMMIVMLFMFVMNYMMILGQDIGAEKGSKVMEVILSSTTATVHLIGKVLGVLFMCGTQIAIYVVLMILGLLVYGDRLVHVLVPAVSLDGQSVMMAALSVLYFVLALYAFVMLTALLVSLVSRTEDIAKALQPLSLLGLFGFYVGVFFAQFQPTHTAVTVLSWLPLLSNYTMPFRVATQTAQGWEVAGSLALYVLFNVVLTVITFRVYRHTVLLYNNHGVWTNVKLALSTFGKNN